MAIKKGIEITVTDKTERALENLRKDTGVSRSELIRHAVEIYSLLHTSVDKGAEILIKRGDDIQKVVGI